MAKRRPSESSLYPVVARFLKRRFGCFETDLNTGTRLGRVDVVGLRDIGGDLGGGFEVIGVEVKAGSAQFRSAAGQAHSYSVFADRCYLADTRSGRTPYSLDEIDIASALGVGLLAVSGSRVREILAAPQMRPIERFRLDFAENLGYGCCVLCGVLFRKADGGYWAGNLNRSSLSAAAAEGKGFVFWLGELSERRRVPGRSISEVYERRYVCRDCTEALASAG